MKKRKTIHGYGILFYFLNSTFIFLFFLGACTFGNPEEFSNSEKLLSLLINTPPTGTVITSLIATDDQGDANIDQFDITSNSTAYNVNIQYSYLVLDSIQSEVARKDSALAQRIRSRLDRIFGSPLYAHTTTVPSSPTATIYTTAPGTSISDFHIANDLLPADRAAFVSNDYVFRNVRSGNLNLLKWHVNELILGGTITNGTAKSFEVRLPPFDVELSPTCSTGITNSSSNNYYIQLKMHNLLKDTSDPTNGYILDEIFNATNTSINSISNPDLTNVILTNTDTAFLFYGCSK